MKKSAYFDNGATTAVAKEVLDEMLPFFSEHYGNPSSIHSMGDIAAKVMSASRKKVSNALKCRPSEIIFTSGGTESDNLALIGTVLRSGKKKVITSAVEHSAILEVCAYLKRIGYDIVILPVDKEGKVSTDSLAKVIDKDTALVSVMTANNVIGTIQPIAELSDVTHKHNALFHTDAVQAFTKVDIDVARDGIDLLSISGHKIHGPKGVGALYVRNGIKIDPMILGGGQENGLRSSTENVPCIVGLGKAAELAMSTMNDDVKRMQRMRDEIIDSTLRIKGTYLNGPADGRLCNNAHFGFDGVKGMDLILSLNKMGIMASTASACTAGSADPSHVMTAIGRSAEEALSSLRISLSRYNTQEDVDLLRESLPKALRTVRGR
ncbi:MAG: IscS subfamily cysteine desulfurase [Methanomassiliicoccaceae archaeon]|nr:IscS subfamily cysteine desulfurase [Methanomassiliicoccaceae archaeon]